MALSSQEIHDAFDKYYFTPEFRESIAKAEEYLKRNPWIEIISRQHHLNQLFPEGGANETTSS